MKQAYAAFNARDMEGALSTMRVDVEWPNGMEGGTVHGHEGVREYWTRQWGMINPHVDPVSFELDSSGSCGRRRTPGRARSLRQNSSGPCTSLRPAISVWQARARGVRTELSVSNRHPKATAVVVVVVVVDCEDQTTIHRHACRQLAANQIRRTQAAVYVANIRDQRAHAGAGHRAGIH